MRHSSCHFTTRPVDLPAAAANDDHEPTGFERAAAMSGWRRIAPQDLALAMDARAALSRTLARVRVADRCVALALRSGGDAGLVGALLKVSRGPKLRLHHLDLLASALLLSALAGRCTARLILDRLRGRFGARPLAWSRLDLSPDAPSACQAAQRALLTR
jgi:hypothetical protein